MPLIALLAALPCAIPRGSRNFLGIYIIIMDFVEYNLFISNNTCEWCGVNIQISMETANILP